MSSSPKCGAALEIILDTNYAKAQGILDAKATGTDLSNKSLAALKWKQSEKKPASSMIFVNETVLGVPIARLLYDRLKASPNLSCKLSEISYKLSRNADGTTESFLMLSF